MNDAPSQAVTSVSVFGMNGHPEDWNPPAGVTGPCAAVIEVHRVLNIVSDRVSYNGGYVIITDNPDVLAPSIGTLQYSGLYKSETGSDGQHTVRIRKIKI